MNLQEMMNQITTLGGQIETASRKLSEDAANSAVKMDEIERQQQELRDMQKRMNALKDAYDVQKGSQQAQLTPVAGSKPKSLKDMLASNEYARAFAYAVRHGLNRKSGMGNENVRILFDALTEGGGDPVGTDGGFLVPEDIDNQIRELKRALNPMAPLFGVEEVNAPTGWRVVDTAPTTGMALVEEMGTIGSNDQPAFAKIAYEVKKYAQIVPVSNELASDNVANLFGYLARWFAKKAVITENGLILAALETLTGAAIGAKPLNGLKSALNKELDPAIAAGAVIICNQDGFDYLDQLEDDMGRGLLQPDPVNATQYRILGHDVHVFANSQMPGSKIYIGDGKEFGTMFTRKGFELSSTDIGGNAWKTDSIEVRGIVRIGFSVFDSAAMVCKTFGA